jgi:hypothetical protein
MKKLIVLLILFFAVSSVAFSQFYTVDHDTGRMLVMDLGFAEEDTDEQTDNRISIERFSFGTNIIEILNRYGISTNPFALTNNNVGIGIKYDNECIGPYSATVEYLIALCNHSLQGIEFYLFNIEQPVIVNRERDPSNFIIAYNNIKNAFISMYGNPHRDSDEMQSMTRNITIEQINRFKANAPYTTVFELPDNSAIALTLMVLNDGHYMIYIAHFSEWTINNVLKNKTMYVMD